ncbi:hypothetical protein D3C74_366390 [compost metagenome]
MRFRLVEPFFMLEHLQAYYPLMFSHDYPLVRISLLYKTFRLWGYGHGHGGSICWLGPDCNDCHYGNRTGDGCFFTRCRHRDEGHPSFACAAAQSSDCFFSCADAAAWLVYGELCRAFAWTSYYLCRRRAACAAGWTYGVQLLPGGSFPP